VLAVSADAVGLVVVGLVAVSSEASSPPHAASKNTAAPTAETTRRVKDGAMDR
jgi:hypothetical protein